MSIQVIVLAAGHGKRMQSNLPKVLHTLGGKPLLTRVVQAAMSVCQDLPPLIVYGYQGQAIVDAMPGSHVMWVEQKEQLGTGHAVMQALPRVTADRVLILCADVPLISKATLNQLIEATPKNAIGMLTVMVENPKGYGRIKRNAAKKVIRIVEEKDATEKERAIKEINPGIYLVPTQLLKKWLPALKNHNAQSEYYLTDIIARAVKEKVKINDVKPEHAEEVLGVNDRIQLATLERFYQQKKAETLMQQGVTILDPSRLDIRGEVQVGKDVVIDVNVILEGKVVIGDECIIGPQVILRDVQLGDRVIVKANSTLEGAEIASGCHIGPFARIRPGTVLAKNAHIGNFVEIKKSNIGAGTKINHLSYVGDAEVGQRVNIGAGTITCNYDGANKHKTIIGDDVHIGSDTQLVAPVTIGRGADIGAGSTVTKEVPAGELTVTHNLNQRSIKSWKRPTKLKSIEEA